MSHHRHAFHLGDQCAMLVGDPGLAHDEFERALQSPEVRDRHAKLGAEPMPMSPEQFDAAMREDLATLGKLLRDAGVKAN